MSFFKPTAAPLKVLLQTQQKVAVCDLHRELLWLIQQKL